MNITPITATTPACFGVCCPQHGQCARYAAAEGPQAVNPIATCDDNGDGSRPLFLQMQREEVAAC
jgi:hypothetical protein